MAQRRLQFSYFLFWLLLSCHSSPVLPKEILPTTLDGGWQLRDSSDLALDRVPPVVRDLHVSRAVMATYAGPVMYRVTLYQMPTESSAFELGQKWRPLPGSLAFAHKAMYAVAEPVNGAQPVTQAFCDALNKALP